MNDRIKQTLAFTFKCLVCDLVPEQSAENTNIKVSIKIFCGQKCIFPRNSFTIQYNTHTILTYNYCT